MASPGYHLWQAALRWKNAIKVALEKFDLTPTQFFVLGAAGWLSRTSPPKQRDVAEFAGLDLMTTSQVVRTLERAGVLARADDPADSRSWLVTPTEKGRKLLKEAAAVVRATDASYFAGLGAHHDVVIKALSALGDRD